MCAPATLNILGHTPGHDFNEPIGLLTDCHRRIEMFLELLQRAVREHAGAPLNTATAEAVRNAQRYFAKAAPKHTADEEESLFPRMKAAAAARAESCGALARLEHDHEQADALHAKVDVLLGAWLDQPSGGPLPPAQAAELKAFLHTLRELYRGHIYTEEAEVFPLAGALLTPPELTAVGEEMRARRRLAGGRAGT